jgi:hypothetical protein
MSDMNTELFGEREVALRIHDVVGQSEQLVCSCGCKKVKTNSDYE